jgi:TolB-like protein
MVTADGYVKILDFGLAKLLAPPAGTESAIDTLTKEGTVPGVVMGTVSYMSPEQALGKPLDSRTDVFPLGAVLYEMATGGRAFEGETPAALFDAVLHKTPTLPSSLNSEIPTAVDRVIRKALDKKPELRFESAGDLLAEIQLVQTTPEAARPTYEKSIVVLPFENISPDKDNEYFADGLTEEIISDLTNIRSLRVISRTSSMMLKDSKKDIKTIGREIDVQYVLEGSVRKAGDALRITAQLIDTGTDAHLWAKKYTGTLDDVFDLQERISRRIVEALEVSLTADEDRRLALRPIPDPRAYDTWLRVKQAGLTYSREGFERGLRLTESALELVGNNALLLATLGWLEVMHYSSLPGGEDDHLEAAELHVKQALELEPDHPWALFVMGAVNHRKGDMQRFVRFAQRSIQGERNPHVLSSLAVYLGEVGRTDVARRYAEEGVTLDPLSWLSAFTCGYLDLLDGRFGESLDRLREGAEHFAPGEAWSAFAVGYAAMHAGENDEASARFSTATTAGGPMYSGICRLFLAGLQGDTDVLYKALEADEVRTLAWRSSHTSAIVASCLARFGDSEVALDWLEHAVDHGFSNHRYLGALSPLFQPLHGNPRFEALLELARQKERAFEV